MRATVEVVGGSLGLATSQVDLLASRVTSSHLVHVACVASQIVPLSIAKAGARYWD